MSSTAARWGAIVARRPGLVLAAAAALVLIAAEPASRLSLRTDLDAMLPSAGAASEAYRAFVSEFGAVEKVFVTIRLPEGTAPDPDRLGDASDALAAVLSSAPDVRTVRTGPIEDDERFLAERLAPQLPLLLDDEGVARLRSGVDEAALDARVAAIRDTVAGPGAMLLSRYAAVDPLGLAGETPGARAVPRTLGVDPLTGAVLSWDDRAALVIVTPVGGAADPEAGRRLESTLDAAYASVRSALGTDLAFEAVGGPLYAAHDERALRADLIKIVAAASVLILVLIVLAFDGAAIPTISFLAVAVGQVWCAALVASFYGAVTAVGVGFAAILLGLGDDFTIHLGARVRELWLAGRTPADAVAGAIGDTGPGIVSAALTTAAAFAVLGWASFRPIEELGVVTALGVILVLVSTFLVAAPLMFLAARLWKRRTERRSWRLLGRLVALCVTTGSRAPRVTLIGAAVITIAACVALGRLRIDADLGRLRPEHHPAVHAERGLARDFGLGLDTTSVIVPAPDLETALDRAASVAEITRRTVPAAEVTTPSDWIVGGERRRKRLAALAPLHLDAVAERLAAKLDQAGLDERAFVRSLDGLRAIGSGRAPEPPPRSSWPAWMAESVVERPGAVLVAVQVNVAQETWTAGPPEDLLRRIEALAPGAQVANARRLAGDVRRAARSDLSRLAPLALGVVLAIVLLSHRGSIRATTLTFAPVLLGATWCLGVWGLLGRPLDIFALAVLPVLAGLGVDDGLHVLHVARRHGDDLARAAGEAGRGIVLTNLTTCAGFASLVVSDVPGLRNGGLLIAVGNLFCLVATLVVLPALAQVLPERGRS